MKNIKLLSSILLVVILISCNKYPNGPSFSLRSAHDRVSNTWIATEISRNGINVTNDYQQFFLELERDGRAEWRYETGGIISELIGNWELIDNSKVINLNWGLGTTDEWRILKLKSDEVWFENEMDTVNFLYKMVPR